MRHQHSIPLGGRAGATALLRRRPMALSLQCVSAKLSTHKYASHTRCYRASKYIFCLMECPEAPLFHKSGLLMIQFKGESERWRKIGAAPTQPGKVRSHKRCNPYLPIWCFSGRVWAGKRHAGYHNDCSFRVSAVPKASSKHAASLSHKVAG